MDSASFRNRCILSFLVCILLLFLSPVAVPAQSETTDPQIKPSVLIASLPIEGSPDQGVRKVLASVMRFQLERMETQTLTFATTDEEALVRDLFGDQPRDPDLLVQSLLEYFSGLNHEFLALAGYIKKGEEIQVSFYIADLRRGEVLASAFQRVQIDFALDDAMLKTLREILPRAEGRIEEVAREKAVEAVKTAEAMPEQTGEEDVAETIETEEKISETTQLLPEPKAEQRFRPLEFSIGFAPFVPVGMANDVFGLSFSPFVYANYRIPLSAGILGLGLCTGLNIFDAEESGIASYFHYVVPLGVDVRFTTADENRIGLFVRTNLGVAINASDFGSLPAIAQEGLSRFLAFGSGGVGGMFAISPGVGIAIDIMYQAYVYFYEESTGGGVKLDWIMGFVPAIYLYTRL